MSSTARKLSKDDKARIRIVFFKMGMPPNLLKNRKGKRREVFQGYVRRMEKALLACTPPENVALFMARVKATWP